MLKTIFDKLENAWEIEFKAISVKKVEENEMTIEFGEKLSFPNFSDKVFPEQSLDIKVLGTVYLIFLNKYFPFNKRFYDPDSRIVFFRYGDKTEEEICQFVIEYINNAGDEKQQDLLVKNFQEGLPMEKILEVVKEYEIQKEQV